jgi:hypothetical protein
MPENANARGSVYPSGRLGDWAKFISIVGIVGVIALYLVHFLASTMDTRMTDNTAALTSMANAVMTLAGKEDHHDATTVEMLDAEKSQTNATKVLVRVTVQSCLNQAKTNKLEIDRCWSSIDREPMYPGGTTASNPKALPKPTPEPFSRAQGASQTAASITPNINADP